MNLFSSEKRVLQLPNAELIYIPDFYSVENANAYFKLLKAQTNWQHDSITLFGKTHLQPRLTALYGNNNEPYTYSNITMKPTVFTKPLLDIKADVEQLTNHRFTSVLLNLYRFGSDSNGWHSDNEKELGMHPVIASVSFGAERYFHFKHRTLKDQKHKLLLEHGSLLIMKGEMQAHWLHQIPKTKREIGERINLTFRYIKRKNQGPSTLVLLICFLYMW